MQQNNKSEICKIWIPSFLITRISFKRNTIPSSLNNFNVNTMHENKLLQKYILKILNNNRVNHTTAHI